MGATKERCSEFNKDFVKHVPWNKSGEDFEVDGGLSEASEEPAAIGADGPNPSDDRQHEGVRTELSFTSRKQMWKHTETPKGCTRSRTAFQGGTKQTMECSKKFQNMMMRTRFRGLEKRKEYEERWRRSLQRWR